MRKSVVPQIPMFILVVFAFIFPGNLFILTGKTKQSSNSNQKMLPVNLDTLRASQSKTVVLADPIDPYYVLAEEISETENLPQFHTLNEALDSQPVYLIWVASPQHLSDQAFSQLASALQARKMVVSIGIITGSSLDLARALWNRNLTSNGKHISVIPREQQIYRVEDNQVSTIPLSNQSFIEAIQYVDYVTYQGHGTPKYWKIEETEEVTTKDIPELPPLLVNALSCQTFKPWGKDSIALGFVDQGAAAYVGFVHSPLGYSLGEPKGFSFYNTWPDFPIGNIVQVQNHAYLQGFLSWPFYFMLGDPRESFLEEMPYRLENDLIGDNHRVLTYTGALAGVIPVHIPNGAAYQFVTVSGGVSAADNDLFYNQNVQSTNIGADKYLLFNHKGGDFTISLYKIPPWYHFFVNAIVSSLDHTTVIYHAEGSFWMNLIVIGGILLVFIWILWRKKCLIRSYWLGGIVTGLVMILFRGGYAVLRQERLAVLYTNRLRTMDITYNIDYWFLIATLCMVICAAWLFFNTRSRLKRCFILLAATLPGWLMGIFWIGVVLYINLLAKNEYGVTLYGYGQSIMAAITSLIEMVLLGIPLVGFDHYYQRRNNR